MGVTSIRTVINNSTDTVRIDDHENSSASVIVGPRQTIGPDLCNIPIPWCTSTTDFANGHFLVITGTSPDTAVLPWWIWQQWEPWWTGGDNSDRVRFSRDGKFHDVKWNWVPGDSRVNGDREVVINEDGTITFVWPDAPFADKEASTVTLAEQVSPYRR